MSPRIKGKPQIHRKPVGAKRGRKATGRTSTVVSVRLKGPVGDELKRRAKGAGETVNMFARLTLEKELRKRPGQGTRAKAKKGGK